ncbi:MAG: pilin [Patescibacteria group bacterium]
MRIKYSLLFFSIIAVTLFLSIAPHVVFADPSLGGGGGITNPLDGGPDQTITSVLKGIINWMLGLVGILALIALIIGGARMIIDFGNEDQVKKAKATILWAVIGLAVVILSYAIINIVTSEILGTSGPSVTERYEADPGTL